VILVQVVNRMHIDLRQPGAMDVFECVYCLLKLVLWHRGILQ